MAAVCLMERRDNPSVSIPKRVSEVLWLYSDKIQSFRDIVSIPKRVSEVLWLSSFTHWFLHYCDWVSIPKRVSEVLWQLVSTPLIQILTCFNP